MKTDQTKVFFKYEENGIIVAVAKDLTTNEEIATREVKLRHGDNNNKIVGRKYAFKKLMDYVHNLKLIADSEVEALWKQFGSNCKQPNQKLVY